MEFVEIQTSFDTYFVYCKSEFPFILSSPIFKNWILYFSVTFFWTLVLKAKTVSRIKLPCPDVKSSRVNEFLSVHTENPYVMRSAKV